jgi:hypothetical protein
VKRVASRKAQWRAEKGASAAASVMTKTKRDIWTRVEIGVSGSDATHHFAAFTQRAPCPTSSSSSSSRAPPPLCYAHPVAIYYCVAAAPARTPRSDQLCHYALHRARLRRAIHLRDAPRVRTCPLPIDLSGVDGGPRSSAMPPSPMALSQLCPLGDRFTPHLRLAAAPCAAGRDAHASGLAQRPARRRSSYRVPRLPGHALRLRPRARPGARARRASPRCA